MDTPEMDTMNAYQKQALDFAVYPNVGENLVYPTLGIAHEAGDLAGNLKKLFWEDEDCLLADRRIEMADELGDVLWYVAALAHELGVPLSEVARRNIERLKARQKADTLPGDGDGQ